ncbi:AmmeMemoRadiSam system protein B [Candidatus Woesearchaeota archaeon]|nr:MAG: AmmeMemoRadiSam system protein B [Candidatus Woesearchaeota archaeon]
MIRRPVVAGMFYEENSEALIEQIKECFLGKFGPGKLPDGNGNKLRAVIAPHAGYNFSGSCAAWSYREIAEAEFPEVFVILGTNHQSPASSVSLKDFETPLGVVKNDVELTKKLGVEVDEVVHANEHSIEVQLPFLQFVFREKSEKLKIVPILVGEDNKIVAKRLVEVIGKKRVVFIVSADFTHYGIHYGYIPFKPDKIKLRELDLGAVKAIQKIDSFAFENYLDETQATICGKSVILCLLKFFELKKEKVRAELLEYYSSGDISGDYTNSVGYAAIAFR